MDESRTPPPPQPAGETVQGEGQLKWRLLHSDDRSDLLVALIPPLGTLMRIVEIEQVKRGTKTPRRRPVGVGAVFIPGAFIGLPGDELPEHSRIVKPSGFVPPGGGPVPVSNN